MNALTLYLLEASICLGVFYLFYLAVLHRQPSFRYNRAYLLTTSALGWILPLLEVPFGWGAESSLSGGSAAYLLLAPAEGGVAQSVSYSLPWWELIYGLGLLVMLTHFAGQFFRLYRMVRDSQPQAVPHRRYRLLYTGGQFPTASFFHYLFWDNTQLLTVEETRQIMTHEEAHIRQGHSYDVLYMTVLKTLGWFHPLVYLYDRALIQTHEYAADAAVMPQTSEKAYARLLSKRMLTTRNILPINHFFYPSQTLNRIHMIYAKSYRTPWYKYVLIVPVFASLFFTFSCQPDDEEITRQAVAQSYDEVKNDIQLIDQEIQTIIERHYPTQQAFATALDAYRTQNPGSPPPSAVDLLKDKASAPVLSSLESLITQRDKLREKMTHLPDTEGVYTVVENQPEPPNGIREFYKFVGDNIKYPAQARQMGVEGKVFVQFDVDEYGELTNVKVIKGMGAGCDEEAVRVVEEATEWNPGTTDGKPVNVRMVMPITFKLDRASEDATSGKSVNATSGKIEKIIVIPLSAADKPVTLSEVVVVAYIP